MLHAHHLLVQEMGGATQCYMVTMIVIWGFIDFALLSCVWLGVVTEAVMWVFVLTVQVDCAFSAVHGFKLNFSG